MEHRCRCASFGGAHRASTTGARRPRRRYEVPAVRKAVAPLRRSAPPWVARANVRAKPRPLSRRRRGPPGIPFGIRHQE
eukprot:scaffold7944_cov131-Isochrysis_galbana.AAC.2